MFWVFFISSMAVGFLVFFGIADKLMFLIPRHIADILNKLALAVTVIMGVVWYKTQDVLFLFIALLTATFSSLHYARVWAEKKETDEK